MASWPLVTRWHPAFMILGLAASAAAQDLPLPEPAPPPAGESGFAKPTVTIKPPVVTPSDVKRTDDAREAAIRALEQQLLKAHEMKRVADAAKQGDTTALRQLIVMAGPVDLSILKSPRPPATIEGKVALIGVNGGAKATRSLEKFFGAPLTPEREQQLLETVRSELAANGTAMDVKVAGWWPEEGVMAVTMVPRG
jgi:hypothetical protein